MGLNINSLNYHGNTIKDYERYGSYSRIHILRKWVAREIDKIVFKEDDLYASKNMKLTKFPCLINHDDAEGGYISFKQLGITKTKNMIEWNDLDRFKKELKVLSKHTKKMPPEVKECFDDLLEIVNPEDEETCFVIFC